MTDNDRRPLSSSRRGFRFKWWGGEYLEIYKSGDPQAFECINMSPAEGNGHLPPFTREVFTARLDELTKEDYAEYRSTYRETQYGK